MNLIGFTGQSDGENDPHADSNVDQRSTGREKHRHGEDMSQAADGAGRQPQHKARHPNGQTHHHENQPHRGRREEDHFVPSRAAILASLIKVSQFLMAGMITPTYANSIASTLRTVLSHLPEENTPAASGSVNTDSLRGAVKMMPELLAMLEPLLSDQQLRELCEDPH